MRIKNILLGALVAIIAQGASAQHAIEKSYELSKISRKGYFYSANLNSSNNLEVIYKVKNKKDKESYEVYEFDNGLNLVKQNEADVVKDNLLVKPDKVRTFIYAEIGGASSFDVLSLKLHLYKITRKYTWVKEKGIYNIENTETQKLNPKSVEDKAYEGYISFPNYETGNLMVLASVESKKEKKKVRDFSVLNVSKDLTINEIPLKLDGQQTLVYSCAIPLQDSGNENEETDIAAADMIFVFAPAAKSADPKKYTFIRMSNSGKVKEQFNFNSPSSNLAITAAKPLPDGSVYLFGSYTKEGDAYEDVFNEYGPLTCPGVTGSSNYRMAKYEKKMEGNKMEAFSIIKISNAKVEWIKNNSIKDVAKLVKKAPSQKKVTEYKGKALDIQQFSVFPDGQILVSGQLTGTMQLGLGNPVKTYKELVCFHLDKTGNIRAQYGLSSDNIEEKLNTIFPVHQRFIPSADGKSLFWEVLENKSIKGYENFIDAYSGAPSYYSTYLPSIARINISDASVNDLEEPGKHKFVLNRAQPFVYSEKEKAIIYIGRDENSKTLWLCKYPLN